ncbi:MAG: alpha/beta fold hydrolase, partial [Solirubrobacterales bacterium]
MPETQEPDVEPYVIEDVEFPSADGGHTLSGTFTTPRGDGPFPAAVLVSGSGPQDRDETVFGHKPFRVLADHLTKAGIAVLRFDDRGVGRSTGVFATATSHDFAADVGSAVDFLATKADSANLSTVGLIGHSEGGLIAPMVAVARGDVAFIVLLAGPGLPGRDVLLGQQEAISRSNGVSEETIEQRLARSRELYEIVGNTPDPERLEELAGPIVRLSFDDLSNEEKVAAGLDTPEAIEAAAKATTEGLKSAWLQTFLKHDPREALKLV